MKRMHKRGGYTLVEMMVSLAIGLVSIGAVSAVLISSSGIYRVSESRARIQENARFSIGVMQEDIRMAGFMGCFNLDMYPSRFTNLVKNPTNFENDYSTWVTGFEAGGSGWSPALESAIGSGGKTPVAGNDVLVVRMPGGKSTQLSDSMPTTSVPIPVASTEEFVEGGLAIVSDCAFANVFEVGKIAAQKKLVHAQDVNISPKLTKVFSNADGAMVTPVTTVSYFIAAASDGVKGNKSLWRQERLKAAEELADGVEQMQLEYGIDTDAIADGITNKFVTADAIGTARVTAVKVSLLLKAGSARTAMATQTWNFDGYTGQTATDKRLYTPFTTTIALRNRVN